MKRGGARRGTSIKALASTLLAVALPAALACGRDPPPDVVRLVPDEPRESLRPDTLGIEVAVLDGVFRNDGWRPMGAAGTWRVEQDTLHIEPGGEAFDLERPLALDAAWLHALEVTLASRYKVRLSLSWKRRPAGLPPVGREASWVEQGLALDYSEGRGDPHRKTFTFDLRSHSEWSGTIERLRLRLEPARSDERLVVWRLRGFRQTLPPDVLSEQSRRPWKVELDREIHTALLVPPEHPVEREILVPEAGLLQFAVGATGRLSAPIVFRIAAARAPAEPSLLFESVLEPVESAEARRWRPARVDLGAFAGERLRLRAESLASDGYDPTLGFPVWANPEILPLAAEPARPNVVLISVDTLRADHLSVYGYERPTSPRIDAWARRFAAVFRHAVAQAPWTLPSHSSMLTGLDALRHGVNHPFRAAPEALETLAERLREEGYFTAAITGGGWLHPSYGLAQGFDRYRYWLGGGGDAELETHAEVAGRWLDELREPFFLFLHTYAVHDFTRGPGPAPDEDPRSHRVRQYDLAVSRMDELVGRILERVAASPLHGRTIVALTSDHGEDLGEDGVYGHGSLRDQTLLVPLLLELPGGRGAGAVIDDQVRSVDLVPTLLDLAGAEVPADLDGVSLVALLERGDGAPRAAPPVAASYFSLDHGLSLRVGNRWKYVYDASAWDPAPEALFRLPGGESPERDNLAPDHPQAAPLRALARGLLGERLEGLSIRFESAPGSPFSGTLRGDLVRAGVPKSLDLGGPWLQRAGDAAASFSVPPGQRFHLLFEHVGEPRFELEAAGAEGGEARLAIDLEQITLPATFRWTGSAWRSEAAGAVPGVTIEWRRSAGLEGTAPFESDPELRRQLEALGYLG